ncbi:MAG: PQQ-binding-like beta-propeller repeat protein [Candidatus Brocadiia bacterium]
MPGHTHPSATAWRLVGLACTALLAAAPLAAGESAEEQARQLLEACGVHGGLVVHVGCGDGKLTAALRADPRYLVHGLDADRDNVRAARRHIRSRGLYGPVAVDPWSGGPLPYADNLVNLLVDPAGAVPPEEALRVLCPRGVAATRSTGRWTKRLKPRPENIDEWTHYLHDATNNAVAHDAVIGPPRRLQWVGSPRWSRHHDRMASMSALVAADGRLFYILDEGSRASILLPARWALVARDAFNGTVLWKRRIPSWYPHLWPFKSGHAQLPRRLVAVGDRAYATLALDAPLTALDARTGQTVRTYEGSANTEEVIASQGALFLIATDQPNPPRAEFQPVHRGVGDAKARVAKQWPWDAEPRRLMAFQARSGQLLWQARRPVVPLTLAADGRGVYFHDGERVVCLDRRDGSERWASEPVSRQRAIPTKYGCILVVSGDVVLFAGGDRKMWGLSAKDGQVLWTGTHHRGGHNSPEDLLVLDGVAYSGEIAGGRHSGVFTGYDVRSGEVRNEFQPDVDIYWFHHRCYRSKATDRYILTSRTGIEFVDPKARHWEPHHWVRGGCLYGIMPANGMVYAPPHSCACYIQAKLYGLNALAPGPVPEPRPASPRLEKGPAYDEIGDPPPTDAAQWPTYRHDPARSGSTPAAVPARLATAWEAEPGGALSSPTVAGGTLYVAAVDQHTLHALDAASGQLRWSHVAGGRVDSPPTVYRGRVLFGSADGTVTCLRAADGALAWRFRAAPQDRRVVAWEQVESVWPVHGSVLVHDGVVACVAGRSMFLDGGLRFLRLDARTGQVLSETVLDHRLPGDDQTLQSKVRGLNMPTALPDVLSTDGRFMYMRDQAFDLEGRRTEVATPADIRRQGGPRQHLFCGGGFLDGSWFHRIYWIYGTTVLSGAGGWPQAGRNAPAGRILAVGPRAVYGYGREPEYYRWSTPLRYHLFAAEKDPAAHQSWVAVAKSPSQNPAGKPVSVEAWVKSEDGTGVVVARGAGAHGYALYLKEGKPQFAVRVGGKMSAVGAQEPIGSGWTHLAGVLDAEQQLLVYVDGKLAAKAAAPGFIAEDPHQPMEIGADEGGSVGDYESPFGFKGAIDEVRIYRRALGLDEIAAHAQRPDQKPKARALVAYYPLDGGKASDASGRKNHGYAAGAETVEGRLAQALRFRGVRDLPGGQRGRWARIHYLWTRSAPIHARAMVLAGSTLFLAGPPNLVDEEEAFDAYGRPQTAGKLEAQHEALEGRKGALLLAVGAADGKTLAQARLDFPPRWDGMAVAGGRLYLVTTDGKVLCLAPRR